MSNSEFSIQLSASLRTYYIFCMYCSVLVQESRAINAHRMVQDFAWRQDYRRADCQLCQVKNYNLTYSLFSLQPPTKGWELACHHGCSHCGGTDTVTPIITGHITYSLNRTAEKHDQWTDQGDVSVVGFSSRGVHWTDIMGINDQSLKSRRHKHYIGMIGYFDAVHLFYLVLCVYNYIVFTWLSTQGKRKLWLRVSMVTGREPS